jgi:hypothetical protein
MSLAGTTAAGAERAFMDEAWTWAMVGTIASLVSGSLVSVAPSAINRAPKLGWWLVVLAPLPLVIWDLLWVIMGNPPEHIRRALSLTIGALAGAVMLLGATEMLKRPANAQPEVAPGQPSVAGYSGNGNTNAPNNNGIIAPNNSGIIAPNSQGSIFTQGQHGDNYLNKDPRSWGFTQQQWDTFKGALAPPDHTIVVYVRLDDLLARDFKNQIVGLINSVSGWKANDFGDYATNTLGVRGIVIRVPDATRPPPEAQTLMNAFLASGIQPSPIFVGDFGAVQIAIGSPPRQ